MILHQLNDDSNVVRVVLDGDDSHDVGRILRVGVLAVFVCKDEAGVGFVHLRSETPNSASSGRFLVSGWIKSTFSTRTEHVYVTAETVK